MNYQQVQIKALMENSTIHQVETNQKRRMIAKKDLTRAEAPCGFRITTWSIPFQSFVISIAAL